MDQSCVEATNLDLDVQLHRDYDDFSGMLRQFLATIRLVDPDMSERTTIGSLRGWIVWDPYAGNLAETGDAASVDATNLGRAAWEVLDESDNVFEAAILLDRARLLPEWRGQKLLGSILDELLDLLHFSPDHTIVVTQPEPQKPEGGPYEHGPVRDAAMARLCAANRVAGFHPWKQGPVWWRPVEEML